ncbi:MAG: winged helix-turn-helix transcriptional regulator [Kiloniellaceae bacterium]|nr:winged helix-turn-helix transcriptional regulator [Kiloniellaceae bacterium]
MSKSGQSQPPTPPRFTTGPLLDDFGQLFRRCHLRSQQAFARAFEGTGLSPLQVAILELVRLNAGISHGAIAEAMATAPSVVTTAMKPLRRDGLLLEETAKDDGRRSGYRLSAEGNARFDQVRLFQIYVEELMLGPLSADERRSLKGLLQRLVESGRL